ncbi:iron ABC transporter permease [Microbacterium sp. 2FI]|uniref:FecCD family ABC transporter permease n=1 Tax=Microbacterium sp. 2FI TaxID=2502193 RepID=UPI00201722FA|nr:iron ABC transporter permease [Microbacterium sp. 2FI]
MNGLAVVRAAASRRHALMLGGLVALLLAAAVATLLMGDYPLTPAQVWTALTGAGERVEAYVVLQVRLPRLLMALLVGAALGVAGALLQSLLRNPLASPELLGISGGSSVAAVFGLLILGITGPPLAAIAFAGGLAASLLLLAAARGRAAGYRLILAGIGLSFFTASIIGFLMTKAQLQQTQAALVWLTGSLSSTPWWQVVVLAVVWVVALPVLFVTARWLPVIALGPEAATGLGVRPGLARLLCVIVAVLLTAVTCAFVGPISFIALCAPAIARPLVAHGRIALAASALVGATLLAVSDLIAQFALPGVAMPVGVVTGALGAVFLLWLLATSKGRTL